jgi:transposase InsO family protein
MTTPCPPKRVNQILYRFRQRTVMLATVMSVVAVCHLLGISRQTFYRGKRELTDGQGYHSRAPHRPGRVTPEATEHVIVALKAVHPDWGKRRIARELFDKHRGHIRPNTVQKIVRKYHQPLGTSRPKRQRWWRQFEAIAPHVFWQMDICDLDRDVKTGETIYLLALLDDHSRYCLASRLCRTQDTQDVLEILHHAVTRWGCPDLLLVDHGKQFVDADCIRVCCGLGMEPRWCGKGHPHTKGKIERFFETVREEHARQTRFVDLVGNQTQLTA